mmetsp:Transcript_64925/g.120841  ORF Transcript_64925/g.120841 Transcript_64925/m.120841 type:complete len:183 (-) Transcript_64925:69-617(-)
MGVPPSGSVDYYATLGLDEKASESSVKTAYRKLVLQWHPDKLQLQHAQQDSIEQRIREINAAYEILSNPVKRMIYDSTRRGQQKPSRHFFPTSFGRRRASPAPNRNLSTPSYIILNRDVAVYEDASERRQISWLRPGGKVVAVSEEENSADGTVRVKVELQHGKFGWVRVKDSQHEYLAPWL